MDNTYNKTKNMNKKTLRMQMLAGIITEGQWDGWQLGYAQDNIFYIHPANNSRPWMDGRITDGVAIISAEKSDGKVVEKFLQDLGNQLGATPYDGDYNNIELRVNEQDLDSLFNY